MHVDEDMLRACQFVYFTSFWLKVTLGPTINSATLGHPTFLRKTKAGTPRGALSRTHP